MIITNLLTASQSAQVADLEALCKQYEPLQGSIFLASELNFDPELPCFYLLYNPNDENELIAFLSIFVPAPEIAELYAYTAPVWRRQGCFNTLLEAALHALKDYNIEDILFVHEPTSSDATAVLETLGAEYQYSEYLLHLPGTQTYVNDTSNSRTISGNAALLQSSAQATVYTLPENLALLPATKQELSVLSTIHAQAFKESLQASQQFLSDALSLPDCHVRKLINTEANEPLSLCCFTIGRNEISIFGVAVHPGHQRKGFAASMLKALFSEISSDYPQYTITLEVNSRNIAAFSLYQKLGFVVSTQFDYSYGETGELLEMFEDS